MSQLSSGRCGRLLSRDAARGRAVLEKERQRIAGAGWYRCWLRFVIRLAQAESAQAEMQVGQIVEAFRELTHDVHPFTGRPRACDLYSIRRVIRETVTWGLSLLRTESEWRVALDALSVVSEGTESSLDREDGGPLTTGALLEVLLPYAADPIGGRLVRNLIERNMARREEIGTYYPTHAEYTMRLARARHASGDEALAREAWTRGAVYLAGYGYHKDPTIYDIIQSAPALASISREVALQALVDAQPLANAVIAHTDQRSTNHAPNAWFENLLKIHQAGAIALLARTITEDDGDGGWPTAEAIHDVLKEIRETADPVLVESVHATVPFEVKHDSGGTTADSRLAPVIRLAVVDRSRAAAAIRRIAAEVADYVHRSPEAAARVEARASELSLPLPRIASPNATAKVSQEFSDRPVLGRVDGFPLPGMRLPVFPANPSFVELLAGLRNASRSRRWNDSTTWADVILSLSYHLGCLIDEGREEDARRLLRFFARDTDVVRDRRGHPIGRLATALDVAGYSHVAAVAYAHAYAAAHGDGGYLRLGDQTHGHLLERAMALDSGAAKQVLADEVAYFLRANWSSYGTSRHLVERLAAWGEPHIAEASWREAFAVVSHRLPLAPPHGWFARLNLSDLSDWTVDESIIALLLARLSEPRLSRKLAALLGIVYAIQRRPDAIVKPLRWWLSRNTHVTSFLLIMDALWQAEPEPFIVSEALEETLTGYAGSGPWGGQWIATLLLERIGCSVTADISDMSSTSPLAELPVPPRKRRAALLAADIGGTLEKLAPLWPELPELVVRRLYAMIEGTETHKERMRERYRHAFGDDDDADFPPTPVLLWESELLQAVLHDELCRPISQVEVTEAEFLEDESLIDAVLPHSALHLGLATSRTARPTWLKPVELNDGFGELPIVGTEDPAFTGWIRLAAVERQYVSDPARQSKKPMEVVTLFAGAIAAPAGTTLPQDTFPFEDGDEDDWWLAELPTGGMITSHTSFARLIRLTRRTDWLGDAFVLIPPLVLRRHIGIESPSYGEPLIWKESGGAPALVLRTWRLRNANSYDGNPVDCEGTDLILRPDLMQLLCQMYRMPINESRVIWRASG